MREQEPKRERDLSDTEKQWGGSLASSHALNRDLGSGVLGYGISATDVEALTVFIAPNTDISDKEQFPDSVDDRRVLYERLPLPELQDS